MRVGGYLCVIGMFLLAALIVFIIQSSCVILKNKMIFHKRRIIKVTHASGEVDYNVEINGFLGLPFLWQIDQEDMGFYIEIKRGMPLEAAIEYVKKKDKEYYKRKGYKVIKYEKV
jgi:hypothetical protein